jgi:hypothetical protein
MALEWITGFSVFPRSGARLCETGRSNPRGITYAQWDKFFDTFDLRLLELPFSIPPLREKLAWNPRVTTSPAHAWMRTQIVEVAAAL